MSHARRCLQQAALANVSPRHQQLPVTQLVHTQFFSLFLSQVMETKDMLYIVTEYAKNGEMFGEYL